MKESPSRLPCGKQAMRVAFLTFLAMFAYLSLMFTFSGGESGSLWAAFPLAGMVGFFASIVFFVTCVCSNPGSTARAPAILPVFGICAVLGLMVLLSGLMEGVNPGYYLHLSPILATLIAPFIAVAFLSDRIGLYEACRRLFMLPALLGIVAVFMGAITILANLDGPLDRMGGGVATALVALVLGPVFSAVLLVIGASEPPPPSDPQHKNARAWPESARWNKLSRMSEVVFLIEEAPEGGFTAKALGEAIFVEGETLEDLRGKTRDAVRCHFEGREALPLVIRLHSVRDELIEV